MFGRLWNCWTLSISYQFRMTESESRMGAKKTIKRLFSEIGLEIRRVPRGFEIRRAAPRFRPDGAGGNHSSRGSVAVTSFTWATTNQFFDYLQRKLYTRWDLDAQNYNSQIDDVGMHKWGLKGFGYSLIIETVRKLHSDRKDSLNVLDVGGGGSGLPRVICEEFSDRCWLVDDFGVESGDKIFGRCYEKGLRETLATKNPMVQYVFKRLGDGRIPELPQTSFDLIYSVSTLEHIPMEVMGGVFDHMFDLLGPRGCMVHTIDITRVEFLGWQNFLARYFKEYGVDPAVFAIENLDGTTFEDPYENSPLLENVAVEYLLESRPKYVPEGTLVLAIRRSDGNAASAAER
jgi:hypothetical protein